MNYINTQGLMELMQNFDKLFDIVRLVDPVAKKVIEYNDVGEGSYTATCYDYWKNGAQCQNCISSRAFNEKDTFVKIEFNQDKIFMIMATPTKLADQRYIMEMLKDITNTGIIPDLRGKTIEEINEIVAQLNKEVVTDELTQVFNRRYLKEQLPVAIHNAKINKSKLSVIMIDFDCFKNINDIYGHVVGDFILKEMCAVMKSIIRKPQDWICRYGGEEFLVVLPDTDLTIARQISENLRVAVQNAEIRYDDKKISVTISLGCYTMDAEDLNTDQLLASVDKNLYRAKENGRNTVVSS